MAISANRFQPNICYSLVISWLKASVKNEGNKWCKEANSHKSLDAKFYKNHEANNAFLNQAKQTKLHQVLNIMARVAEEVANEGKEEFEEYKKSNQSDDLLLKSVKAKFAWAKHVGGQALNAKKAIPQLASQEDIIKKTGLIIKETWLSKDYTKFETDIKSTWHTKYYIIFLKENSPEVSNGHAVGISYRTRLINASYCFYDPNLMEVLEFFTVEKLTEAINKYFKTMKYDVLSIRRLQDK